MIFEWTYTCNEEPEHENTDEPPGPERAVSGKKQDLL
jgi:hypothetical protein